MFAAPISRFAYGDLIRMAANANIFNPRLADRKLFLVAAIGFPLLVLIGYFRTYYFRPFFVDVRPIPANIVHVHAVVMSLWVIYFTAQSLLIRTKNIRLHMTLGWAGVALAVLVVITGMAVAYDTHIVRQSAPPGLTGHQFFIVPTLGMLLFVALFAGAIYYRKKPAEHKGLMLITALNFLPPAVARMPVMPELLGIAWTDGFPDLIAVTCVGYHAWKHKKLNKVFAAGAGLLIFSHVAAIVFSNATPWLAFTDWLASL